MSKVKKSLLAIAIFIFIAAICVMCVLGFGNRNSSSGGSDNGSFMAALTGGSDSRQTATLAEDMEALCTQAHTGAFGSATGHSGATMYAGGALADGGKYYLEGDINVNSINVSGTVTLCLNGHKITGTKPTDGVISIDENAHLLLHDCKNEGCITSSREIICITGINVNGGTLTMYGGKISENARPLTEGEGTNFYCDCGGVYVYNGGTFTMYGGEISENGSSYVNKGGGVRVNNGNFTMNGGVISGNNATNGAGVYVGSDGVFTMNGGTIENNRGTEGGGACVENGNFTMNGGEIVNNVVGSIWGEGSGGGVEARQGSTFNLSGGKITGNNAGVVEDGQLVIKSSSNLLLNGTVINITQKLADGTEIGLNRSWAGDPVFVATNGYGEYNKDEEYNVIDPSTYFYCEVSNAIFELNDEGELTLSSPIEYVMVSTSGSTTTSYHTDLSNAFYYANNDKSYVRSRTITLLGDIISDKDKTYFEINISQSITLDLNGHTVSAIGYSSSDYFITVSSNTFTLKDGDNTTNTGVIKCNGSGGVVRVNGGAFVMNGGTISGGKTTDGAGVYVNGATFTMNGGVISGNEANDGAGVYVNGATFAMYGGTISDNEASHHGGGIYATGTTSKTVTINGGTISGNKALSGNGGGIFVQGCKLKLVKGEISSNKANFNNTASVGAGGGVCLNSNADFTMSGGEIKGNFTNGTSQSGGSGVCVASSTFTMTGGEISGNFAYGPDAAGGGVYVLGDTSAATFTMQGGIIKENEVQANGDNSGGGGVYVHTNATFSMQKANNVYGTISDNTAVNGGGVYVNGGGKFTMASGVISGNTANSNGGGVGVNGSTSEFTMRGGEIKNNNVLGNIAPSSSEFLNARGGGVFVRNGKLTINNGTISGNTVVCTAFGSTVSGRGVGGGGVCVIGADATFTMYGGTISGNAANPYTEKYALHNTQSEAAGGGVCISLSSFTMSGGTISGNSTYGKQSGGGGVCVLGGTFNMTGKSAKISGNTSEGVNWRSLAGGGGVCLNRYDGDCTFNMSAGTISGNEAMLGGGVCLYVNGEEQNVAFNITGGTIGGSEENANTASYRGGGVYVYARQGNATFTMKNGAISGNTAYDGGGVCVCAENEGNATFIMEKNEDNSIGTISGNTASGTDSANFTGGGGVYVYADSGSNATFTMKNGAISDNTAYSGGGVYVYALDEGNATFTMSGGTMSGNTANGTDEFSGGGGVYVYYGAKFEMKAADGTSGTISKNTATKNGGGVFTNGTFTMNGGVIGGETTDDGNEASAGGGVFISKNINTGTFELFGGVITNNKASSGGGVFARNCSLTVSGGLIRGNKADNDGGGVFGILYMSGGAICGNTANGIGGGVYGTLYMTGGVIGGDTIDDGNSATKGGGVYINEAGKFEMCVAEDGTFGTISNNTASEIGGGVYVAGKEQGGNIKVDGGKIIDNTLVIDDQSNLVLPRNYTIIINEKLAEGTLIGLSCVEEEEQIFTSGYGEKCRESGEVIDFSNYFFSDNPGKCIRFTKDYEVVISNHSTTHYNGVEVGCFEDGNIEYWTCELCGNYYSDAEYRHKINKESVVLPQYGGHSLSHVDAKPATCYAEGNIEYWYCDRANCGKYFSKNDDNNAEIENKESVKLAQRTHNYVLDTTNENYAAAKCEDDGLDTFKCSYEDCNGAYQEVTSALGHQVKKVAGTPADCENEGREVYYFCERENCDKHDNQYTDENLATTFTTLVIPAKGHAYGAPTDWAWAEDNATATATFTCSVCSHKHEVTASGEAITFTTVPATCLAAGSTTYSAKVSLNGTEYTTTQQEKDKVVSIAKLDHVWTAHWDNWSNASGSWTITVTFTCNATEVPHNETPTEEVTVEHSTTKAPDCIHTGTETYTASIEFYGKTYPAPTKEVDIAATGEHNYASDFTTDTAATCTTDGWESKHCTVDGCTATKDGRTIAAHGHDWTVTPTDGTSKTYTAFDMFNVSGLNITFVCGYDASHNETFTGSTDEAKATVTYPNGDCLHYEDTSVEVSVTLARYGTYNYTVNGLQVSRYEAQNVVWGYSTDNANWAVLTDGASFVYDKDTSYSVRVRFNKHANDKHEGATYAIVLGSNIKNAATNYSYEKETHGDYLINDSSRTFTITKAKVTVGGENWLNGSAALMSGFVKQDGTEYKYYSASENGATEVVNAIVRYASDKTATVTYPVPEKHNGLYEVSYNGDRTANASARYEVTATLTLKDGDNYEFVTEGDADLNDGVVTITKVWYIVVTDNGFVGDMEGWTFGGTVSALPALEKDDGADATVTMILWRNDVKVNEVAFDRGSYSYYINSTMPVGNYKLVASVSKVTVGGIEYAELLDQTFTFSVTAATLEVTNLNLLTPVVATYDGLVHINQAFVPVTSAITAGSGVWENYDTSLYGSAEITFSHADWNGYFTAAQIEANDENTLFVNADNYTALYKISALNYQAKTGSFNVTINKATYDLKDVVFNGAEKTYNENTTYTLEDIVGLPAGVTAEFSNSKQSLANEEGYVVTATLKFADTINYKFINSLNEDDEHITSDTVAVYTATLKIMKATYEISVTFEGKPFVYDGQSHTITIEGELPAGVSVRYYLKDGEQETLFNGATNAGTYNIIARFTGDVNYNAIPDKEASFTIAQQTITLSLSFTDATHVYDGEQHSIELEGTLPPQVEVAYNRNRGINADVYEATAKVTIKDVYAANYKFAEGTQTEYSATLTITEAPLDMSKVKFENKTVTYTGNAYSLAITGTLPAGVTYSYENNGQVDAGTYTVTVHFYHSHANYGAIADKTATLIINKADYDMRGVTFSSATVAYTGNAHSLSIRGTLPAGVTYIYENNSLTNVGSQEVTVKFTGDSKNYNAIPDMKATLTVTPASFGLKDVSLEGMLVNYDGKTHTLTVSGTLPEGVEVKYFVIIDGKEVEFTGAMNAGNYDIIARFVIPDSENYKAIRPLTARLTVVEQENVSTKPPVIEEPEVEELETPVVSGQQPNQSANVVLGEPVQKDTGLPRWVIAVIIISAEAIVIAGIGCYIAFGSFKKKKR